MIVENIDTANVLRIDIRLIGDRADDIARHNLMDMAYLDTEALHALFRRCVFAGALWSLRALRTLTTVARARLIIAARFPCLVGAWDGLMLK